jgi:mannose-6-phosphate isomerase-like protein (cupin superfamily)
MTGAASGRWQYVELSEREDSAAPDGSEIRLLARGSKGNMAHFRLLPEQTSTAVAHHTIEELWFVVSGEGRMWLKLGNEQDIKALRPGVSIFLPTGTHFQFQNTGELPLDIVGVSMPPWPGEDEAYPVEGGLPPNP